MPLHHSRNANFAACTLVGGAVLLASLTHIATRGSDARSIVNNSRQRSGGDAFVGISNHRGGGDEITGRVDSAPNNLGASLGLRAHQGGMCAKAFPEQPRHALKLRETKQKTRRKLRSLSAAVKGPFVRTRTSVGAELESIKGHEGFVRQNPMSDKFGVVSFDHLELWCGDAASTWRAFSYSLGMPRIAKSELSTGNIKSSSHVIGSGNVRFVFTAPYGQYQASETEDSEGVTTTLPFDPKAAHEFIKAHGTAVRAVGIQVEDAREAYKVSTANGAKPITSPYTTSDAMGSVTVAEVGLYGDTVLRWISYEDASNTPRTSGMEGFLPGYEPIKLPQDKRDNLLQGIGIADIDHVVGNVPELIPQANAMISATGFHEFAEFTTEDVGTVDSGLNSLVLANNLENVLLPINEPVQGRRQSQIETFLQHHQGAGVQHIALKTPDIFNTIRKMREREIMGGFELMRRPSDEYYRDLPRRLGDSLTPEQYKEIEELGLLADKDDEGILIQIFTAPVTHRPTLFIEIIQRIGCEIDSSDGLRAQRGGCGGFGKGNFRELFKSIEDYEKDFVK